MKLKLFKTAKERRLESEYEKFTQEYSNLPNFKVPTLEEYLSMTDLERDALQDDAINARLYYQLNNIPEKQESVLKEEERQKKIEDYEKFTQEYGNLPNFKVPTLEEYLSMDKEEITLLEAKALTAEINQRYPANTNNTPSKMNIFSDEINELQRDRAIQHNNEFAEWERKERQKVESRYRAFESQYGSLSCTLEEFINMSDEERDSFTDSVIKNSTPISTSTQDNTASAISKYQSIIQNYGDLPNFPFPTKEEYLSMSKIEQLELLMEIRKEYFAYQNNSDEYKQNSGRRR